MGSPIKVFKDSVHGYVQLDPLLVTIIDTPEFQRLRNIKQMWTVYRVYPGASHNRFEHSIGVCHLAGLLTNTLKNNQGELNLTAKDILCVQIAGLCHDLGHGPFSHLFDDSFLPRVLPPGETWSHEIGSGMMFDHLIAKNKAVNEKLIESGLVEEDLKFIKDLIRGRPDGPRRGERYEHGGKKFLFEIVSNKVNGFDVDRFDYFVRDCHHLGLTQSFDYMRFIVFARVITCMGQRHICIRDKEAFNAQKLFVSRYSLYYTAINHAKVTAIELMVTDALLSANNHLNISENGLYTVKMSEAIRIPVVYTHLTDAVYENILKSTARELQASRETLKRIEHRELYVFIGQTQPLEPGRLNTIGAVNGQGELQKTLEDVLAEQILNSQRGRQVITANDIRVKVSYVIRPRVQEEYLRLYSTFEKHDRRNNDVADAFDDWCRMVGLTFMPGYRIIPNNGAGDVHGGEPAGGQ